MSALDLAAAIRRGEIGPLEACEHFLDRVARDSDRVGAFVTVTADRARSAARSLQEAGPPPSGPRTALWGVPTAIKDLNLTAGVPTKLGSAAFADFVPQVDDHVVSLLAAGGLVSLGKTNTPELGLPCYTEPDVAPVARTPWDLGRGAGGSSGGAGAAVAAGLVPIAQGNDGAGSIRIPASCCGLVGLKPSRGRVSGGPLPGDPAGLAINGPLARTVRDAAALLDVMSVVPMPGDPWWAPPLPEGTSFLESCDRPLRRLRVGRLEAPPLPGEVDPQCTAAVEGATGLLTGLGHEVVEVTLGDLSWLLEPFTTVWSVLAASVPVDPARESLLRPLTRALRERGRTSLATQFTTALATLRMAVGSVAGAIAEVDVVVAPTLAQLPAAVGSLRDDADPWADFAAQVRFTPFTALANLSGVPAVSLPLHWTPEGLPVGVQLLGGPAGEVELLGLAAELEAAQPWFDRHPPGW